METGRPIYCSVNTIVWLGASLMYFKNETCYSYRLLPVVSFKYRDIFHNVVEMPSHDINTSVQLCVQQVIIIGPIQTGQWTVRPPNIHHNIKVSAHHWSLFSLKICSRKMRLLFKYELLCTYSIAVINTYCSMPQESDEAHPLQICLNSYSLIFV